MACGASADRRGIGRGQRAYSPGWSSCRGFHTQLNTVPRRFQHQSQPLQPTSTQPVSTPQTPPTLRSKPALLSRRFPGWLPGRDVPRTDQAPSRHHSCSRQRQRRPVPRSTTANPPQVPHGTPTPVTITGSGFTGRAIGKIWQLCGTVHGQWRWQALRQRPLPCRPVEPVVLNSDHQRWFRKYRFHF